jgi:predicted Zn-dependent protease
VISAAETWQNQLSLTNPKVNQSEYLKKIDGLVVGEDPRQGFVEDDIFYHPEMKFQFPVPVGWEVENLPSRVQITSNDKGAAILFTLGSEATLKAEASNFVT